MGQVTTILDFHRLNVMTTLSAEFQSFGLFCILKPDCCFQGKKESEKLPFYVQYIQHV